MTETSNSSDATGAAQARDVDDTTGCPVADACEGCRDSAGPRDVYTADTPVGPVCLTLCPVCVDACRVPRWSLGAAARRVLAHCDHLARTLDDRDDGWGPCLRCGRMLANRDDRPYCPACEDGPDVGEEGWS